MSDLTPLCKKIPSAILIGILIRGTALRELLQPDQAFHDRPPTVIEGFPGIADISDPDLALPVEQLPPFPNPVVDHVAIGKVPERSLA